MDGFSSKIVNRPKAPNVPISNDMSSLVDDDVCETGFHIPDCVRAERGFAETVSTLLALNTINTTLGALSFISSIRLRLLQQSLQKKRSKHDVAISHAIAVTKVTSEIEGEELLPLSIQNSKASPASATSRSTFSKTRVGLQRWSKLQAFEKVQVLFSFAALSSNFAVLHLELRGRMAVIFQFLLSGRNVAITMACVLLVSTIFASNPSILLPNRNLQYAPIIYILVTIICEIINVCQYYFIDMYTHSKDPKHANLVKFLQTISFALSTTTIIILLTVTIAGAIMIQRALNSAKAMSSGCHNDDLSHGKPAKRLRQQQKPDEYPTKNSNEHLKKPISDTSHGDEGLKRSLVSSRRLLNIVIIGIVSLMSIMFAGSFIPGRKSFQAAINMLSDLGSFLLVCSSGFIFVIQNNWRKMEHVAAK
ncbi:hypothetical protein HDU97_002342 [Phlyctochytrium planicorne]|nr:hypothetical protein HDU97_002342 [Phlyctochytrium planicorne]